MSHLLDQAFDEAHNQTVIAKDLKHVQWGRIDYMNVTYLTTKWGLWQYVSFISPGSIAYD